MSFTVRIDRIGYLHSIAPRETFVPRYRVSDAEQEKIRLRARTRREQQRKEKYELQKFRNECEEIVRDTTLSNDQKLEAICKQLNVPYEQTTPIIPEYMNNRTLDPILEI